MKRVILSVLVLLVAFSGVSFAAVTTAAKVDPKVGVGVYAFPFANAGNIFGSPSLTFIIPTIGMNFTKEFRGEAGFSYSSCAPKDIDNSSVMGFIFKGDFSLAPNDKVSPHWGGLFGYLSGQAIGENISGITIGVYWGISAAIMSNFSVYADIYPIKYTSLSGSDSTTGTVTDILVGAFGAHYYF